MNNVKVTIHLDYWEPYLPSPRHRKLRYRKASTAIRTSVPQVRPEDAPVAFLIHSYHHIQENRTEVRYFRGHLYERMNRADLHRADNYEEEVLQPATTDCLEAQIKNEAYVYITYDAAELPQVIRKLRAAARHYVVIDGCVWRRTGEPRYVIVTFGLGNNHGGTGLFVEHFYNSNIGKDRYFTALEGDKAVAAFNSIAARRGDTDSVGKYGKMIDVLMPETVRLRPAKEHGDGDPFLNTIEGVIESGASPTVAGLFAMALAVKR